MRALLKITLMGLMTIFTLTSQAGFHMEPYAGLGLSNDWEQGSTKEDLSLTNFGIKLGYQSPLGFQVGGDIQHSVGTFENTNNGDIDFAGSSLGAYLGYQTFLGFRGYISLFRSAMVTDESIAVTYTGTGHKIGVGYRFIPWLAANLEYINTTFTDADPGSLSSDLKVSSIMATLSFPFVF